MTVSSYGQVYRMTNSNVKTIPINNAKTSPTLR